MNSVIFICQSSMNFGLLTGCFSVWRILKSSIYKRYFLSFIYVYKSWLNTLINLTTFAPSIKWSKFNSYNWTMLTKHIKFFYLLDIIFYLEIWFILILILGKIWWLNATVDSKSFLLCWTQPYLISYLFCINFLYSF